MASTGDSAMHQHRHEGDEYRRIELITGTARRRRWTAEEKAAVVARSFEPGINVSALARRCGINRGQLHTWRRDAMREAEVPVAAFVPVRLEAALPTNEIGAPVGPPPVEPPAGSIGSVLPSGMIEIEVGGLRVRLSGAVDLGALRTVLSHVGRRL